MSEQTRVPGHVQDRPCARCAIWPAAGDRFCTTCGAALDAGVAPLRPRRTRLVLFGAGLTTAIALSIGISVALVTRPAEPTAAESANPTASGSASTPSARPGLGTAFGSSRSVQGVLCPGADLECERLVVPADQSRPDGEQELEVMFGRHRATDDAPIGTLVIATGGPGSSGISLAPQFLQIFPDAVIDRYDLVFFEQRGVHRSAGLECAEADLDVPPWADIAATDFDASAEGAAAWVDSCLDEAGVASASELERYATGQAAADLDAYLDHIGADKVVLYGESYGTLLVQVYAANRPERVAGLVLDAVVDPELDALTSVIQQTKAFSDVLDRVLEACDDDPFCADDFAGTTAAATWDGIAERLRDGPVQVALPSRSGENVSVSLSLDDLVGTSANLLYDEFGRGILLRALASVARDDLGPLTRLAALTAGIDPETQRSRSTPIDSSAAFFAIACQDYLADRDLGTQQLERGYRSLTDEGARLAAAALRALPCVTGFAGDADGSPTDVSSSVDFPVLVLTSTADPATPTAWAEAVAERMDNAYVIVTTDGGHGTFGWGWPCPDDLVKEFLVFNDLPQNRRTECFGTLMEPYQPLPLDGPEDYEDVLDALVGVEQALLAMPDYIYWDGVPQRLGCPHGGSMQMSWRGGADTFDLDDCRLLPGWALSGSTQLHADGSTTMDLELPNGELAYESDESWNVSVEGTLDGLPIKLDR